MIRFDSEEQRAKSIRKHFANHELDMIRGALEEFASNKLELTKFIVHDSHLKQQAQIARKLAILFYV